VVRVCAATYTLNRFMRRYKSTQRQQKIHAAKSIEVKQTWSQHNLFLYPFFKVYVSLIHFPVFCLFLLVDFTGARNKAQCYFSDVSLALGYQPCDQNPSDHSFSSCCFLQNGDICLSSGLCFYPGSTASYRNLLCKWLHRSDR